MGVSQFVEKYYMHDSLIESIDYDNMDDCVTVLIDFAFWMQPDYNDSEPETVMLEVRFNGVSSFSCPDNIDFSMTSILEMSGKNDTVTFLIINDFTDEDYEISITAESVDVAVGEATDEDLSL